MWLLLLIIGVGGMTTAQAEEIREYAILANLNAAISWYHDLTQNLPSTGLSADSVYQGDLREVSQEVVRKAFESARAEVPLVPAEGQGGNGSQAESASAQRLEVASARISARITSLQTMIESTSHELASARGKNRAALATRLENLKGELELETAKATALKRLSDFNSGVEQESRGLSGKINKLSHTVSEVFATNKLKNSPPAAVLPGTNRNSLGMGGEMVDIFRLLSSARGADEVIRKTTALRNTADGVRKPLHDAILVILQQDRVAEGQNSVETSAPMSREQYDALTARFNQMSAALIPLYEEISLIDQASTLLLDWRRAVIREATSISQTLAVQLFGMILAIGVVMGLSALWRRLAISHIKDPKRRRPILVLRKIVVGILMAIILIFGLLSEFSSLATFAGFVTAGIAVGLQTVLVSVAAYFLLIGRSGLKVGDRITIAGVTGEVVDVGLTRFSLMELSGAGADLHVTGRVVVLSNSVLFQAAMPLYKQTPGGDLVWHEVVVGLNAGGNYQDAHDKVLAGVRAVYEHYRDRLDRKHKRISEQTDAQIETPVPQDKLRFSANGLELLIRYPVDADNAGMIDESITKSLLSAMAADPDFKAALTGTPVIHAA